MDKLEKEELIHGAQICGEYLEDNLLAKQIAEDKKTARELFTIEFIIESINSVFKNCCDNLIEELMQMLVFDAIVGNNDRHFYNWGVIKQIAKGRPNPKFSPLYDTARGMLWNWSDDRVIKQLDNLNSNGKQIENYIKNASPRVSIEGDPDINHFDLIRHIWATYSEYKGTISEMLTLENEKKLIELYDSEFARYFVPERNYLVRFILTERFRLLRSIVQKDD